MVLFEVTLFLEVNCFLVGYVGIVYQASFCAIIMLKIKLNYSGKYQKV